ncbi:hypothetical protein AB1Y20_005855 [Prymnesium parvum]|uniref:Alkaline phosphatase n=1 Tax=Prymnesium parvum TaxID=97485 RepID=A0AB34J300_PRYPA
MTLPVEFLHGVASGDPWPSSIVLWTRVSPQLSADPLSPAPSNLTVGWSVRREDGRPGRSGEVLARRELDWTVKVEAWGLEHSVSYTYAFSHGAAISPTGAFTLPPPRGEALRSLRYGVFSCSSWAWGHFHAYAAAAAARLDFWLHVGDYTYEYGRDGHYPTPQQAVRFTKLQPAGEAHTLEGYRLRHALHREDADLQALSASAPLIAVWDDHEVANDPWVGGAQNHNPEAGEGGWWERKRAAIRAYHEWLPTRTPPPALCGEEGCAGTHEGEEVYRAFDFGSLARLYVLETRLLNRSKQAQEDPLAQVERIVGEVPPHEWRENATLLAAIDALREEWTRTRTDEGRTLLGGAQLSWLRRSIANASAADVGWHLLGQQVIVQPRDPPDLYAAARSSGALAAAWLSTLRNLTSAPADAAVRTTRALVATREWRLNADFDGWDGYPAARARLLRALRLAPAGRVAVYAGDSHSAWAGELRDADGGVVALEFDGTSVTSSGPEQFFPFLPPALLAAGYVHSNPHLAYANLQDRGWMYVDLTRERHHVQFMTVSSVAARTFTSKCDAAFVQSAAQPRRLQRTACVPLPLRAAPPAHPSNGVFSALSFLMGALLGAPVWLWAAWRQRRQHAPLLTTKYKSDAAGGADSMGVDMRAGGGAL